MSRTDSKATTINKDDDSDDEFENELTKEKEENKEERMYSIHDTQRKIKIYYCERTKNAKGNAYTIIQRKFRVEDRN